MNKLLKYCLSVMFCSIIMTSGTTSQKPISEVEVFLTSKRLDSLYSLFTEQKIVIDSMLERIESMHNRPKPIPFNHSRTTLTLHSNIDPIVPTINKKELNRLSTTNLHLND